MWTGWSGVGDGVDTPQTVMTTRAPAVLKTGLQGITENEQKQKDRFLTCIQQFTVCTCS